MDEPNRESPETGKRLTRDDVLCLIEEHGGPEGLDLSARDLRHANLRELDLHGTDLEDADLQKAELRSANLQEVKLRSANLRGAYLTDANLQDAYCWNANLRGAYLTGANLKGAYLSETNLQAASLSGANLQAASLSGANLQAANLSGANLQKALLRGADLRRVDLSLADLRRASLAGANLRDANLEGTNWGDYVLGDEIAGYFGLAASAYRPLKKWHTDAGMYDIAGEFHYREMEAQRKFAWKERRIPIYWEMGAMEDQWLASEGRRIPYALTMYALRFLYGYGERPERVIGWAATVVFGLALVHWLCGTVSGGFLDALYFSAVSFPALGYGEWAPEPQGWAGRFLGAGESFMGIFMMALFLVTFTRKMTR